MVLLDTNTCIALLKVHPEAIARLREMSPEAVFTSVIVEHELIYGAEKSQAIDRNLQRLRVFLSPITVLPFTSATAAISGKIQSHLSGAGRKIGDLDTLIAATALEHRLTVVTHNTREFRRVPGLLLEDWLK